MILRASTLNSSGAVDRSRERFLLEPLEKRAQQSSRVIADPRVAQPGKRLAHLRGLISRPTVQETPDTAKHELGLRTVAAFEAFKGIAVLIAGSGFLALIGRDAQALAERIVRHLHLDPALRVVEQVDDVGARRRVHRHALAAGDVADDLLAVQRVATARTINHQILYAAHDDRIIAGNQTLDRAHSRPQPRFFLLIERLKKPRKYYLVRSQPQFLS